MARKPREEPSGDSWMNTYSDLVTLLMTFFVLLFSMSSVDAEKWERFVKAFTNSGDETAQIVLNIDGVEIGQGPLPNQMDGQQLAEGGDQTEEQSPLPQDFDDLFLYLQQYVEEHNMEGSIEVMKDGDNVVYIRFQNNIFFDPDKSYLRESSYEILDFLGDCLYNVEDEIYIISINGHTAEVDNHEDYAVSDWMLSSERASSVAIYFDDEKNIDPTKLRPMGYGRNFPIATNDTPEGREQNRRVDMTIIKNSEGSEEIMNQQLASLFDPDQFPRPGTTTDILTPENTQGDGAEIPVEGEVIPGEPGADGQTVPTEPDVEGAEIPADPTQTPTDPAGQTDAAGAPADTPTDTPAEPTGDQPQAPLADTPPAS